MSDLEERLRVELGRRLAELDAPPSDPIGAVRAGERLRRRQRGIGVGLGLALILLVSGTIWIVRDQRAEPAPVTPTVRSACPASTRIADLPLPGDGRLPSGPSRASLCPVNGGSFQVPSDALTSRLEGLVDLINTSPEERIGLGYEGDLSCIGMNSNDYSFAIVFTYPNDATAAAWVDSCSGRLRSGGEVKSGGGDVLDRYIEDLRDQRGSQSAAPRSSVIACPRYEGGGERSLLASGRDLELVDAVVCTYRETEVGKGESAYVLTGGASLDPSQIKSLNSGFSAGAVDGVPTFDGHETVARDLIGVTAWGDNVFLYLDGTGIYRFRAPNRFGTTSTLAWKLSTSKQENLLGPTP